MFKIFQTKWFRSAPVVATLWIVITAGIPFGNAGSTNLLRIARIIEDKKIS